MKIAIDAMGGDYAPEEVVKGAVLALEERNLEIILLGDMGKIKEELIKYKYKKDKLSIINCKEYIKTGEFPLDAIRNKRDSSIVVGTKLIKNNKADAFISAGNSGAVMAAALLELGCIHGIRRPTIGAILPSAKGKVLVLDVGANVDCKPEHLSQFALIGSKNAKYILGIENPKIGMLNIGEEENKGNKFAQNAYKKLKNEEEHFRFDAEILLYEPSYGVLDLNPIVKNFTYQVTKGAAGENIELPKSNYETTLKDLKQKNGFVMAVYEFSVMNAQFNEMKTMCNSIIALIDNELNDEER